ncbi:MAG: hypothetical protein N3G80_04275 [Candidatus Micrarchaeota archaeon]|nr:hypothetical protein [Candidatus Micrarchaeota archaeon]
MESIFSGAALFFYTLFVQNISLTLSSLDKLIEYEYDFAQEGLIPNQPYSGQIRVYWAVPNQSLQKLQSPNITVKVMLNSSSSWVQFLEDGQNRSYREVFLSCRLANATCLEGSVLEATVPVLIVAPSLNSSDTLMLKIESEIVSNIQPAQASPASAQPAFEMPKITINLTNIENQPNSTSNDFFGSLQPHGDYKNPIDYLRENPIISITALLIVIVVTGAYLLNSKD